MDGDIKLRWGTLLLKGYLVNDGGGGRSPVDEGQGVLK
jgi:hypothetical protein